MSYPLDDVARMVDLLTQLDCTLIDVEIGDLKITVRKGADGPAASVAQGATAASAAAQPTVQPTAAQPATMSPAPAATPASAAPTGVEDWLAREATGEVALVRASLIGTYYSAKDPSSPPFVEVGSVVDADTVVGIIEVMKLFHSLPAGLSGTVAAILVDDAQVVEHGQPLIAIARS